MKNIAAKMPQLRMVTYGAIAGLLAVAGVFGLVNAEQTDQILASVTVLIGTATSLLALWNVKPNEGDDRAEAIADKVAYKLPTLDVTAVASEVAAQVQQTQARGQVALDTLNQSVAQGRAELERLLGSTLP